MQQTLNAGVASGTLPSLPLGWDTLQQSLAELPSFAIRPHLKAAFSLPEASPSGGVLARMQPIQYKALREHWQHLVRAAFPARPSTPFVQARLVVIRHGLQQVQAGNLASGLKPLVGVLMPLGRAYPSGLGVVDAGTFEAPFVAQTLVAKGQERTDIYLFAP